MRLALYEPDIPQNAGSLMRLGACLGVGIDIIEPCGFLLTDRNFRRAGMDYLKSADICRHSSWARSERRVASMRDPHASQELSNAASLTDARFVSPSLCVPSQLLKPL